MVWNNNRHLTLYHGTDLASANKIITSSIKLNFCKPLTDFGQGFYTTTYLHQAKNWANIRVLRLNRKKRINPQSPVPQSAVLEIQVSYDDLVTLETLCFVTEGSSTLKSDFWDLIRNCRRHRKKHFLDNQSNEKYYDVVFGLVSLWPQTLVINNCDQVSFHTDKAINCLQKNIKIRYQCNPAQPLFQV